MKYAVEMGSGAMIYVPGFIKIGSGTHRRTDSMEIAYTYYLNFSKCRLRINYLV
jgi:hypothetical protein